jgi:hypothetical protein
MSMVAGETGTIIVAVDQARDLYGYELHLAFDPAVIQITDANPGQPGVQIQPAGFMDENQGFAVANRVDNGLGTLDYAMTLLAPTEPVSGAGSLIELGVQAVAPGSSPLVLSVTLASRDGVALPVETQDGSLVVSGDQPAAGSPGGATPTAAPAQATPSATTISIEPTSSGSPAATASATLPGETSDQNQDDGNLAIPSRTSSSEPTRRLPPASALQTVTALENAQPAASEPQAAIATREPAASTEDSDTPDDVSSGDAVAMADPEVGQAAETIVSDQPADDVAESGSGWSGGAAWVLAVAAIIIFVVIFVGRRRLRQR